MTDHVFPQPETADPYSVGPMIRAGTQAGGLSKRELFAAMAMQSMVRDGRVNYRDVALAAIEFADALIAALEKGGE